MLKLISANINLILAFILGYNATQLLLQLNSIPLTYNYTGHFNIADKSQFLTSKLDITALSNAYLFGNSKILTTHIATRITNTPPDTKLDLKLQGIYHGSTSYATITANDNNAFYRVGDSLPNDVTIYEIFPKKVILLRNGQYEILRFIGSKNNDTNQSTNIYAKKRPEKLLAEYQRQLKSNPQQLMRLVRMSAVNQDGKLLGYRIKPRKDASLLLQFNLQTGDILTAVNGVKLNSPLKALGLVQKLATTDKVELEVLRNGQQLFLSFDVEN
jgi:general secretion pathway protein C